MRGKLLISNVIWAVSYQADSTCAHHCGFSKKSKEKSESLNLWALAVRTSTYSGQHTTSLNKPAVAGSAGRCASEWYPIYLYILWPIQLVLQMSVLWTKRKVLFSRRENLLSERFRRSKVVWWSLEISAPLNQSESPLPYDELYLVNSFLIGYFSGLSALGQCAGKLIGEHPR